RAPLPWVDRRQARLTLEAGRWVDHRRAEPPWVRHRAERRWADRRRAERRWVDHHRAERRWVDHRRAEPPWAHHPVVRRWAPRWAVDPWSPWEDLPWAAEAGTTSRSQP